MSGSIVNTCSSLISDLVSLLSFIAEPELCFYSNLEMIKKRKTNSHKFIQIHTKGKSFYYIRLQPKYPVFRLIKISKPLKSQ